MARYCGDRKERGGRAPQSPFPSGMSSFRFSSSRKDTTAGVSSPRVSARISASVLSPPTLGTHQARALQRNSRCRDHSLIHTDLRPIQHQREAAKKRTESSTDPLYRNVGPISRSPCLTSNSVVSFDQSHGSATWLVTD